MSINTRNLLALIRGQHADVAAATSQDHHTLHEKLIILFEKLGIYQDLIEEKTKLMERLQPLLQQDIKYQQYESLPLAQFLYALLSEYSQSAKLFYKWRHHNALINTLIEALPILCLEAAHLAGLVMTSSSSSTMPTLTQIGLENSSFRIHFLVQVMQYIASYYTLEQLSQLTPKGDFIKLLKIFIHEVDLPQHIKSLNQMGMSLSDIDKPVFITVFMMAGFYFNMYTNLPAHHQAMIPHIHFLRDSILHGSIDNTMISKIHHNYERLSAVHLYFNRDALGRNTYFIRKLTSEEQINVSLREILRIAVLEHNQKEKVVAYIETLSLHDILGLLDGVFAIFNGNYWLELDGNFLFYRNVINEILVTRHHQINKKYILDEISHSKKLFDVFIQLILEKSQVSHFIVSVLTGLKDDFLKDYNPSNSTFGLILKYQPSVTSENKESIKELMFFIKLIHCSNHLRDHAYALGQRGILDAIEKNYKLMLEVDENILRELCFLTIKVNKNLHDNIVNYHKKILSEKDFLDIIMKCTNTNKVFSSILMRSDSILSFLINYFHDNKNALSSLFYIMGDISLSEKNVNELLTSLYTLYQWRNTSIPIHEVLNALINDLEPRLADMTSPISWELLHATSLIADAWERVQAALMARQESIHTALANLSERYQVSGAYIHPDAALMLLQTHDDADLAIRRENERLERFIVDLRRGRNDIFRVPEAFVRLVTYHSRQVASMPALCARVNRVVDMLISFLSLPPVLLHEDYHESIKQILIRLIGKKDWFFVDKLLDFMHELHMVIPHHDMRDLLRSAAEHGVDVPCFNKIRRLNPRFNINVDWIDAVENTAINVSTPHMLWHVLIDHNRSDLFSEMLAYHRIVPYPLTLLNYAIAKGHLEIINVLLDAHPDYDFMSQLDKDSRTPQYPPAHHAILINRLDILQALWQHYQNQRQRQIDAEVRALHQHEKAEQQFSKYLAKKKARADGVITSHRPFSKQYRKHLAKQQEAIYGPDRGIPICSSSLIPRISAVLSQSSGNIPTCSSSSQ